MRRVSANKNVLSLWVRRGVSRGPYK